MLPSDRPRRGQALVMFAMFTLVLVLAVMATMSLAHLTHQKMQMQVASDTAAYSQAVATARAYNSVALLNRAQVATMVALAGVDSAISFGGSYRAALNATWYGFVAEFDKEYCDGSIGKFTDPRRLCASDGGNLMFGITKCKSVKVQFDFWGFITGGELLKCAGPGCKVLLQIFGLLFFTRAVEESELADQKEKLSEALSKTNDKARLMMLRKELDRVKGIWQSLDGAAGNQARQIQAEATKYRSLQSQALSEAQASLLPMTKASLGVVGATLNANSMIVANREFGEGTDNGVTDNSIDAAMGSRAHLFITQRKDGQRAIQDQVRKVLAPSGGPAGEVTINTMKGNGYFANNMNHGERPATGYATWGDEEASVTVDYLGIDNTAVNGNPGSPSGNLDFEAWVGSTDLQNVTDQHDWCPKDPLPDLSPPDVRHTMLPHSEPPSGVFDPCASTSCIWPSFIDTNSGNLTLPGEVFGQPKLFAGASLDLSASKHPWNFFQTFRFSSSGPGAATDFRAQHDVQGVGQKLESLSAAMAYYHRPGHWKEPPNLFNPYWRATLVRANIDGDWKADVIKSVSPANGDTLNELVNVGFEGIP